MDSTPPEQPAPATGDQIPLPDRPGPGFWLRGPAAFKAFEDTLQAAPTDEEARKLLGDFAVRFPDVAQWMHYQKDESFFKDPKRLEASVVDAKGDWRKKLKELGLQEARNFVMQSGAKLDMGSGPDMTGFVLLDIQTGRVRSDVPNESNTPKPGEEPVRGPTRKELDKRYQEFLKDVAQTKRALGHLKPKPKKPTACWLVRQWRKLTGWKRPAKPGRQIMPYEHLFWWARVLVSRWEHGWDRLTATFWHAPVHFRVWAEKGNEFYQCSTLGALNRKSAQHGLRVGPSAGTLEEALAEFRVCFPGLFDGTVRPRTVQEIEWWFDRRSQIPHTCCPHHAAMPFYSNMRDSQGNLMWCEFAESGHWEVIGPPGVLWPRPGTATKPASPKEAIMQLRLHNPKLFPVEQFKTFTGSL